MSPHGGFRDAVSLAGFRQKWLCSWDGFQALNLKQMMWAKMTKELVELPQQQHKQVARLSTVFYTDLTLEHALFLTTCCLEAEQWYFMEFSSDLLP